MGDGAHAYLCKKVQLLDQHFVTHMARASQMPLARESQGVHCRCRKELGMLRRRTWPTLLVLAGLLCHAALASYCDASMFAGRIRLAALTADLADRCDPLARAQMDGTAQSDLPSDDLRCDECIRVLPYRLPVSSAAILPPTYAALSGLSVWAEVAPPEFRSLRPPPRGPPLA